MKSVNNLPKLTPILDKWMPQLIKDKQLLENLFKKYGSPINVHYLPALDENIKTFQNVFLKYNIPHQLFYARKANKSQSVVKRAKENKIGVDTASFRELQQALEVGVDPELLVVTAVIKTEKLLNLAVENHILVILDNQDECDLLQSIAKTKNKQTPVGFRVSGFHLYGQKLYSRFGFDVDDIQSVINSNCNSDINHSYLKYKGLHFHLNGYSTEERGAALSQCIALSKNLEAQDFQTEFIDIGGGILINYLESETEWNDFKKELKKAVKSERKEITFNNEGLGYKIVNGKLEGELDTYPFYNSTHSEVFLEKVLNYRFQGKKSVSELLRDTSIEIRMEPGRSLLSQVGMTLARVVFRKKDMNGRWLVGLEMNMSQLKSSSADFLIDPLFSLESINEPNEVYFTGAYCLERDILLKRKITLPSLPQIGDVIGFPNTAGYMMHFFETQAHLFELSVNLSLETMKEKYKVEDFKTEQ